MVAALSSNHILLFALIVYFVFHICWEDSLLSVSFACDLSNLYIVCALTVNMCMQIRITKFAQLLEIHFPVVERLLTALAPL